MALLAPHIQSLQGLTPLEIRPGTFGSIARAMGAATLALFARYPLDHRVLYAEG
ncbi:hypothetical protein [Aurantimonas marina]|uniref:hypothetical protein n=1 Tax=Aurantimonas marina TaxID=2780508 RepID=UPI0019D04889|nr:hypothetical protein [Aurantimonas marina]